MKPGEHIDHLIDDYLDGKLDEPTRQAVELHLAECPRCRALVDSFAKLRLQVEELPKSIDPPEGIWDSVSASIIEESDQQTADTRSATVFPLTMLAAAAIVAATFFIYLMVSPRPESWNVQDLAGSPQLDSNLIAGEALMTEGQVVVTDSVSRAVIEVGSIGTVDVLPGTTLELVSARRTDHRFSMPIGSIHASITAPPRLFFVETPSALAIDLGCEYTLEVDSLGRSSLHVAFGYVELEYRGLSSVVPEGFRALSVPGKGPTVAIYETASQSFIGALVSYDLFADTTALPVLLREAREDDAVTLWLLLERLASDPPAEASAIYNTLVQVAGEPSGASYQGTVVRRDRVDIDAWQDHLDLDLTLITFKAAKKKKLLNWRTTP